MKLHTSSIRDDGRCFVRIAFRPGGISSITEVSKSPYIVNASDRGLHVVCAVMTAEFLVFSKARGNDLSTPRPEYDFPGLRPGDRWCLCATRWLEAWQAGMAPFVVLEATHLNALGVVDLEQLRLYAADPA